jgi:hypothetical protein
MLKFGQASGVEVDDIITAVNTTSNRENNKIEVVTSLAHCRSLVTQCFQRFHCQSELTNLPAFTDADAKDFVIDLANTGSDGVDYSQLLHRNGKLTNPLEFKGIKAEQVVFGLANARSKGVDNLQLLTNNLSKFPGTEAKHVVRDLSKAKADGTRCL